MVTRRSVVATTGFVCAAALSGCLSSEEDSGSTASTEATQIEESCRTVERTHEENLADELETVLGN